MLWEATVHTHTHTRAGCCCFCEGVGLMWFPLCSPSVAESSLAHGESGGVTMEGPLKRKTLLKEGRKPKVNRKGTKIIFSAIFFSSCQYSVQVYKYMHLLWIGAYMTFTPPETVLSINKIYFIFFYCKVCCFADYYSNMYALKTAYTFFFKCDIWMFVHRLKYMEGKVITKCLWNIYLKSIF